RVGLYIVVHHGARADKGEFPDRHTAHDRAVRPQRRAALHQRVAVLALALDQRTRVVDIGEHHARAAEHALLEGHIVVDRDIVLDLAAVADDDLVANEHVLAQRHARADPRAPADVDEVPDARALADPGALVDNRGFVS